MEKHAEDARRKAMVIDIDMLVPKDHLLRKIEKVMDYDWLYERLNPLYNDKVGRPGTDPVVLIKMVLIQHLFGIPSLRQTWRECDINVAYTASCAVYNSCSALWKLSRVAARISRLMSQTTILHPPDANDDCIKL